MEPAMERRASVSRKLGSSFDEAVREFCTYKASEGVAVGGLDLDSSATSDSLGTLHRANLVVSDGDLAGGALPMIQSFDVVAYAVFRRWLTQRGGEAVLALLEDCCTYHDIRMPLSRAKWARAIVASVESECHSSPILLALVADDAEVTGSQSSAGQLPMSTSLLPAMMGQGSPTGAGSVPALRHSRSSVDSAGGKLVNVAWAHVRQTIAAAPAHSLLPDTLFDPVYEYVARQLLSTQLPWFLLAADYRFYLAIMQHLPRTDGATAGSEAHSSRSTVTMGLLREISGGAHRAMSGASDSDGGPSGSQGPVVTAASALSTVCHTPGLPSPGPHSPAVHTPYVSHSSLMMQSASGPVPPIATLLNNKWRLDMASNMELHAGMFDRLGCVGQGSYGSVTIWRHKLTGACYAVKSMDKRVLKHKASVHTVVRELACTLAVDSPYVCGFDFSFTDAREIHMGMRMMWRGDLERWLLAQPHKRFDESTARFYAAQLVVALKHLHQAGVVHRDLKASNVLIDDQGHLRLTDFGLAVLLHTCSQAAPSAERICRGETSSTISHCCLGCLQVTKLKQLQKAAHEQAAKGLPASVAGMTAAAAVAAANRSVVSTMVARSISAAGASGALRVSTASNASHSAFDAVTVSQADVSITAVNQQFLPPSNTSSARHSGSSGTPAHAGARRPGALSASPTSLASNMSPSARAGLVTPTREHSASSYGGHSASLFPATPGARTGESTVGQRLQWATSAHRPAPAGSYGSSVASHLPPVYASTRGAPSYGYHEAAPSGIPVQVIAESDAAPGTLLPGEQQGAQSPATTTTEGSVVPLADSPSGRGPAAVTCTRCGCIGGGIVNGKDAPIAPSRPPAPSQQSERGVPVVTGMDVRGAVPGDALRGAGVPVPPPVVTQHDSTMRSDDLTDVGEGMQPLSGDDTNTPTSTDEHVAAPAPPKPAHMRFGAQSVVHPTVLMDCTCSHAHDDGAGWYKGRAGTSAYWCPQMIARDAQGERIAYGADADWWSFGCLVYCLMTGRSPFASGMGTAHDNALTLDGRISWPRGVFSREAKDLISRLLTVDPHHRLGSGAHGWRDVMSHPWFSRIDWALMEAKVLPAPCVPPYRMATNLTAPPEKIAGQYAAPQHAEAAAAEADIRAQAAALDLTAEDEAIFRACTFTAPDMLVRALLKCTSQGPAQAEDPMDMDEVPAPVTKLSALPGGVTPAAGAPCSPHIDMVVPGRRSGDSDIALMPDAPPSPAKLSQAAPFGSNGPTPIAFMTDAGQPPRSLTTTGDASQGRTYLQPVRASPTGSPGMPPLPLRVPSRQHR